ncbi:hypothetical protein Bbelb_137730 [Branchiostoma belcheri]|nr:hypothetical protein Bbelb_137730 [Branchiostoma belcheri]
MRRRGCDNAPTVAIIRTANADPSANVWYHPSIQFQSLLPQSPTCPCQSLNIKVGSNPQPSRAASLLEYPVRVGFDLGLPSFGYFGSIERERNSRSKLQSWKRRGRIVDGGSIRTADLAQRSAEVMTLG